MKKHLSLFTILFSLLYFQDLIAQNENWDNIISGGKNIICLAEYGNYIWAGTDIGLIKLNKNDGSIVIFDKTYDLPANFITAIALNNEGNIWFGLSTFEGLGYGLVKYDGTNFTIYNTSNSGLPGNYISALCFDEEGVLWIGCSSGYGYLVKFDDVNWTVYNSNNSPLPADKPIKSITIDPTKLWVGTYGGLFSFDGSNWESYPQLPSVIVKTVFVDKNNIKWVGMFGGIAKYNDTTWTVFSANDSTTPLYYNEVNSITIDEKNVLWAGTYKGLVKYDSDGWVIYNTTNSGLPANQVKIVMADKENIKWLGSFDWNNNGRLSKFDEQNWQNYKTWKGGLNSNYINYIKKEDNKTLWIGTDRDLNSVAGHNWKSFSWGDSLNYTEFYSFVSSTTDNDGNLWFALRGGWPIGSDPVSGILKYDGQNWTKYDPQNSDLPVCIINKIDYSFEDNLIWLATSIGAVKYDGNNWIILDTLQNIIPFPYLTTMIIYKDVKWFGSRYYGLIRYDNNSWILYNTSNSDLPDDQITDLYLNSNDNLWISTQNGLAHFDKNNWNVYNTSNSGLPDNWITCCIVDNQNKSLIGTFGGGFVEFDGENWAVYNKNNSPLLGNIIDDLEEDVNGNIWIACSDGGISIRNGISAVFSNETKSIPNSFTLLQNYPNPFNPITKIQYTIPNVALSGVEGFRVQLKVYDILGREIAILVNEEKPTGRYEVEFNASSLASGIYFYRLQAGSFVDTKKMILMK